MDSLLPPRLGVFCSGPGRGRQERTGLAVEYYTLGPPPPANAWRPARTRTFSIVEEAEEHWLSWTGSYSYNVLSDVPCSSCDTPRMPPPLLTELLYCLRTSPARTHAPTFPWGTASPVPTPTTGMMTCQNIYRRRWHNTIPSLPRHSGRRLGTTSMGRKGENQRPSNGSWCRLGHERDLPDTLDRIFSPLFGAGKRAPTFSLADLPVLRRHRKPVSPDQPPVPLNANWCSTIGTS